MDETIEKAGEGFAVIVFLGLIGAGAFALYDRNGWLPDSPQQHQERLQCEMHQMEGGYQQRGMSTSDAEAYCEKQMEAEKIWATQNKREAVK